jgi:succinoglycan biosynthesis protein ExoM
MTAETAIVVATRRRPSTLQRLLDALASEYGDNADVKLVVVDNDPAGSAASVVDACQRRFSGGLTYAREPQEGYATVRNAGVMAASGAENLVFIDDDELPNRGWLDALLSAKHRYHADVVAGPAIPVFPDDAPQWLIDSGVFNQEITSLPSGSLMDYCATRNTLMTRATYDLVPGGFDSRFDRTGGEDSNFFFRAKLAGAHIVWSNEAVVREPVERDRLTSTWVLRRAHRAGNTRAMLDIELVGTSRALTTRAIKALGLAVIGVSGVVCAAVRKDRAQLLRGRYRLALARGMAAAFLQALFPR